jgi:TonB family protein
MPFLALILVLAADPVEPTAPRPPPEAVVVPGSPEPVFATPASTNEEVAPAFATSGYVKPAEVKKGCVANAVRIPPTMAGVSGRVVVRFVVYPDGSVGRYQALSEAPGVIVDAVWQAIRRCQFSPGRDPQGKPVAIWLILPIGFEPGSPPAPPRPLASLTNAGGTKPREAKPGCIGSELRLPNGDQGWGSATFKFEVHEDGTADQVEALSDAGVSEGGAAEAPPALVAAFAEAVRRCQFIPGADASGKPLRTWMILPIRFTEADR